MRRTTSRERKEERERERPGSMASRLRAGLRALVRTAPFLNQHWTSPSPHSDDATHCVIGDLCPVCRLCGTTLRRRFKASQPDPWGICGPFHSSVRAAGEVKDHSCSPSYHSANTRAVVRLTVEHVKRGLSILALADSSFADDYQRTSGRVLTSRE